MHEQESPLTDAAIDAAIEDLIKIIESFAGHAPVRAAMYASAMYKFSDRATQMTPDKHQLAEYLKSALIDLWDEIDADEERVRERRADQLPSGTRLIT